MRLATPQLDHDEWHKIKDYPHQKNNQAVDEKDDG